MLPKNLHPNYQTKIPSTDKQVTYRPMLSREEKILLMAKESKAHVEIIGAVKQVVRNCIIDEGLDVDKLATFDVDFLFLKIRSVSAGNKVNVSYTDRNDGSVKDFSINLDDVKVIYPLDLIKEEEEKIIMKGGVPSIKITDNMAMKLRWPRAAIYGNTEIIGDGDDAVDRLMAHCLDKIYEGDKSYEVQEETFEEIVEFLDTLDIDTIHKYRMFLSSVPHLSYKIPEFTDSTGVVQKLELRSLFDFFELA